MSHLSPRLTVAEVAAELRCSERFVYALIKRREIGSVRAGRKIFVTRRQLEDYCAGQTTVPMSVAGPTDLESRVKRANFATAVPRTAEERRERAQRVAREKGWV